jgi:hypothetical protein
LFFDGVCNLRFEKAFGGCHKPLPNKSHQMKAKLEMRTKKITKSDWITGTLNVLHHLPFWQSTIHTGEF